MRINRYTGGVIAAAVAVATGLALVGTTHAADEPKDPPPIDREWLEQLEPEADAVALIGYTEGGLEELLARVESADGRTGTVLKERRLVSVHARADTLSELLESGLVATFERDVERYLYGGPDYHRTLVQAEQRPFPGMAVPDEYADTLTVCVIDSGIDIGHPDLALSRIAGESIPDHAPFGGSVGDWFTDEIGHGTHVAGIVAALDNNHGATGILPNDRIALHIVKVFAPGFTTYSSDIIDAVDRCVAAGADIINMSLGSSTPSNAEEQAMVSAAGSGVMLLAAAGNDESTDFHDPASYDAVISVAAVDSNADHASFSQRNAQVELAAPGVDVYSTVSPNSAPPPVTLVSGIVINQNLRLMAGGQFAPVPNTSIGLGFLIDCGLGTSLCQPASWEQPHIVGGQFGCLIERGAVTFAQKALNCQNAGGTAAIIYNDRPGELVGTLAGAPVTIPVLEVTAAMGSMIARQQLPLVGEHGVENPNFGVNIMRIEDYVEYAEWSGTSMATPVASGVAALVWSHFRHCSANYVRTKLGQYARDLGTPGRDDLYGHGLVQHADTVLGITNGPLEFCVF